MSERKPIVWHADENLRCHAACEASRENNGNCPWVLLHNEREDDLDWSGLVMGDPCPVAMVLLMIGRAPSSGAKPSCDTCPYFDRSHCRVEPPKVVGTGQSPFPVVTGNQWCGKHPKIEAIRLRQATVPMQQLFGQLGDLVQSFKGVGD